MNAAVFVVALILFSSPFFLFLAAEQRRLAVNVLLSFDSRLAFVFLLFVYYRPSALTSGREKREKEK
jgi:hypothetical protein